MDRVLIADKLAPEGMAVLRHAEELNGLKIEERSGLTTAELCAVVGEYDALGDYVFAFAQLGNIISTQLERALSGSATVTEALQTAQSTAKESLHVPKP